MYLQLGNSSCGHDMEIVSFTWISQLGLGVNRVKRRYLCLSPYSLEQNPLSEVAEATSRHASEYMKTSLAMGEESAKTDLVGGNNQSN